MSHRSGLQQEYDPFEFDRWRRQQRRWLEDLQECHRQHERMRKCIQYLDDEIARQVARCKRQQHLVVEHQNLTRVHQDDVTVCQHLGSRSESWQFGEGADLLERLSDAHQRIGEHHVEVVQASEELVRSISELLQSRLDQEQSVSKASESRCSINST